jgi:tRNA-specific 2-thiouridylase
MRVLAALSGGVDSAVAAALLVEEGHDVVGATMRLWRGARPDIGCCSEAEIDDARAVARQLGIEHRVFNFTDEFDRDVVDPYVLGHAAGRTPNPCIACNRSLKFSRFLERATVLGFDAVATGHHARVDLDGDRWRLRRGADPDKDQSYVLYVLDQPVLARCRFPVGAMAKADVRAKAAALGLRVAGKPDSQDACFVQTEGGRSVFLGSRIPLHPGRVLDLETGAELGTVDSVEMVTVGQRRGLVAGGGPRRYALSVDVEAGTVVVGTVAHTLVSAIAVERWSWVGGEAPADGTVVAVQCSAHGIPASGVLDGNRVHLVNPQRRVAPGQAVVLYDGDEVLGGGEAT